MTDEEILGHFESLGDNCEFGLVQRAAGVERLGFFRFNWATMQALLRALDSGFADIDRPEGIEIYAEPGGELMVRVKDYLFQYHTHQIRGQVDEAALLAQQGKALRFLARKLMEDLRSGEKIFVRKGVGSASAGQIATLVRAMRRYGQATLLWVVPQDETHPMGSAEVIGPGLLKGYVDRFSPYEQAGDFSPVWFDVCRSAYQLWRDRRAPGTVVRAATRRSASNLIRRSAEFGGGAWWTARHATARPSAAVPPLHEGCAVIEHTLLQSTDHASPAIYGCNVAEAAQPGNVYVASLSVWLPEEFQGALVGAVFNGFASIHTSNARKTVRGAWQRIWASARVPPGAAIANPTLFVAGPAGTRLFSTCWKLELGNLPGEYEPDPPPVRQPPPAAAPQVPTRRYRLATLAAIAAEPPPADGPAEVEIVATLPPAVLEVPALAFGDAGPADLLPPGEGPGALRLEGKATPIYLLRGALVHGQRGVVTLGERAVADSLVNFPFRQVAGAAKEGDDAVTLPDLPLSATIHSACHLLCCNLDNYFHWMSNAITRFRSADYEAFRAHRETAGAPTVLTPTLDVFWKWESLGLAISNDLPRIALAAEGRVFVQRLLYVPDLTGGSFHPHPALLEAFESMRTRVFGGAPPRPGRRLFISREDSRNRVLGNEAELAARAERAGFTVVTLSRMSVPQQVRLFAEASHIIAPHGAGLVNLGYCQPGAALCELQMDRYVHWAFRRLAALRGLRYGRLVGTAQGPAGTPIHETSWHLDPVALDAVLADPRFIGG